MRVLVIDEIEALAAGVFGALDVNCTIARSRKPFARRPDGSKRLFGGLNLITSGDWWQLPVVKAASLYHNLGKRRSSGVPLRFGF
jgi:hypothetical protein